MREVTIPQTTVVEDISYIREFIGHMVEVSVGIKDVHTGKFIIPQQFKEYYIREDMYAELVSANPDWAPNKPAGTYRNEDLWRFIDIIREEQQASA